MAARGGFHRVLVAVDGSPVSLRAVGHAARIATSDRAELIALHVVPAPPSQVPGEVADYYEQARQTARRWLREVESVASAHGARLRTDIVVGAESVVDAILGYAENASADLIVTGTRGTTASNRILVGSVANGLVEYGSCAVLVVR